MKLIFTLFEKKTLITFAAGLLMLISTATYGQISIVCTDPTNTIYGLTGNGEIYPIDVNTAKTGTVVKNNTYPGNSPSSSNGMGYNTFNGRFYYFKRNVTASPQEFVSFNPTTNTVSILANSTCTDDIHTGCVSFDGNGYYTVDIQGTLHYYNILTNTWTFITSNIEDQFGNSVTNVIKTQNAGDMAIDGLGNIWLLTSSSSNYGLYKIPAPMPKTAVAKLKVTRVIDPATMTPTGQSFAGIAFKPNGQIYLATKTGNRLYLMQNPSTLTFIGILDKSDVGNDLTSCSFPTNVLPVTWKGFDATVKNSNNVVLNWEVAEDAQNKGFYVQHSLNGSDWEDIHFIQAKNMPGSLQEYSYSHTNNLDGKQYYRIRQVDMDNKISYSEIRTVTLKNNKSNITIWPNPATDQVRITSSGSFLYTKAQLFDLSGKMISEIKLQAGTSAIAISQLPAGTYFIKIQSNNGTSINQKIIKQ
jgi:hypothetical protein